MADGTTRARRALAALGDEPTVVDLRDHVVELEHRLDDAGAVLEQHQGMLKELLAGIRATTETVEAIKAGMVESLGMVRELVERAAS